MSDDAAAPRSRRACSARRSATRELLQSIVEVARAIFARARRPRSSCSTRRRTSSSSRRSSGEGEESLVGKRFPSSTGIAGWVLATRQPLVIEDVAQRPALRARRRRGHRLRAAGADGRPAAARRDVARRARGARPPSVRASRSPEIDLLGLFANQAAIALDLLLRARRGCKRAGGEATSRSSRRLARGSRRARRGRPAPRAALIAAAGRDSLDTASPEAAGLTVAGLRENVASDVGGAPRRRRRSRRFRAWRFRACRFRACVPRRPRRCPPSQPALLVELVRHGDPPCLEVRVCERSAVCSTRR